MQISGARPTSPSIRRSRIGSPCSTPKSYPISGWVGSRSLAGPLYRPGRTAQGRRHPQDRLGRDYIVALNLASSEPGFLRALGLNPMYLGLDLRGGVHFLMQVDMDATIKQVERQLRRGRPPNYAPRRCCTPRWVGRRTAAPRRVQGWRRTRQGRWAQVLHKQLPVCNIPNRTRLA